MREELAEVGCRQAGTGSSSGLWAAADSLCFLPRMCWCRHASQLPGRLRQPLSLHLPIMHAVPRLLGRGASCMACQDAGCWAQPPAPTRVTEPRVASTCHRHGPVNNCFKDRFSSPSLLLQQDTLLDHPKRTCHPAIRFIHGRTRGALGPSAVLQN